MSKSTKKAGAGLKTTTKSRSAGVGGAAKSADASKKAARPGKKGVSAKKSRTINKITVRDKKTGDLIAVVDAGLAKSGGTQQVWDKKNARRWATMAKDDLLKEMELYKQKLSEKCSRGTTVMAMKIAVGECNKIIKQVMGE